MYKISPSLNLEISRDGMKGYITLINKDETSILENDKENDYEEIERLIEKVKGIVKVGLKEEKLRTILSTNCYSEKACIAEGIPPINGKDGYIKYYFDLEKKLIPKALEDGTVDYRELDIINNVNKGELLAELIPSKEGECGYKVTGEVQFYKKGKNPPLRYGKNVKLLENNLCLIAEKNGLVELKDGKVIVSEIFEVDNVDGGVGNIYFNGAVLVRENVLNGFQIKADGYVEVNGILEGAYIENTGDVMVKRGIQGCNKLVVNTEGNIKTKFIENALINSEKSIIAEAIMHSEITAKDNIIVSGKRGLIVGGTCRAGKEIKANILGSSMATTTTLEVGVDPSLRQRSEELKNNINIVEDNLKKITKTLKLLDSLKKSNRLDDEKAKMYLKLLKTRTTLIEQIADLENEIEDINKDIEDLSKGHIKVKDTIYPGVKIIIGNSILYIRDEMQGCTFYRDEGEIKIGPY